MHAISDVFEYKESFISLLMKIIIFNNKVRYTFFGKVIKWGHKISSITSMTN